MKEKIDDIMYNLELGCIDWQEASKQLFDLFSVSQQRELLFAYERRFINENRYESNEDIYKRVDKFLGK